jgi:type I restriction enzyme S subunit
MKDSGVEWLGEVPEHWKVGSLGYYSKIDTGATPDRSKPEYWNGDIPWIKTGEVNYKTISKAEEHISLEGVNNSAARIAPKGTLLMAMYGQGVTRGRVAILGINAAYNQACAGISVESELKVRFLCDYFIAAYPYIRDDGNETSQMNLSSGYIAKIKVTVPPIQEQVAISAFIEREMARLNSLSTEANLVANFLKERRSALISAAVTGKIDVRGWQALDSKPSTPPLEATYG